MSVSGLSSSVLRAYAEQTVEARQDTRTLAQSQQDQALSDVKTQALMQDRANEEALKKKLYDTVKAGVQVAKSAGSLGKAVDKHAEASAKESAVSDAIKSGDLETLKAVKMDETHTVGDALSDEQLKGLLAAPGEQGKPATLEEQTQRVLYHANPERVAVKTAIESGDLGQIRDAKATERSTVGDQLSDKKIESLMTKPEKDGSAPTVDSQVDRLIAATREREVDPDKIRDTILGELDRVATAALNNGVQNAKKATGAAAKDAAQTNARASELDRQVQEDGQTLTRLGQLAAAAQTPLFG
jgi:hypothetical protein